MSKPPPTKAQSKAARALAKLRAERLTPERRREIASMGGQAYRRNRERERDEKTPKPVTPES